MKKLIKFLTIASVSLINCNKNSNYNTKKKDGIVKYVDRPISTKDYDDSTLLKTSDLVFHKFTKENHNIDFNFLAFMDLFNNRLFLSKKVKNQINKIFENNNDSAIQVFFMKDNILVNNILQNNYFPLYGGKKGREWETEDINEIEKWKTVFKEYNEIKALHLKEHKKKIQIKKKTRANLYKLLIQEYKKYKKKSKDYKNDFITSSKCDFISNSRTFGYKEYNIYRSFGSLNNNNNNNNYYYNNFISPCLCHEKEDFLTNQYYNINIFNTYNTCSFTWKDVEAVFYNSDFEVLKNIKFSKEEQDLFIKLFKDNVFLYRSRILREIRCPHKDDFDDELNLFPYSRFKKLCFNSGEWIMTKEEHILKSAEDKIPAQKGGKTDWTCGPNSASRALIILCNGKMEFKYDTILAHCPKYICKETTQTNCSKNVLGGVAAAGIGVLFAPVGGLFLWGAGAAYAVGNMVVGASVNLNVGPCPEQLRDYLNILIKKLNYGSSYRAKFLPYDKFKDYENRIISCVKNGYPCIVLLIRGATNMHYVNIIGVSMEEGKGKHEMIVSKFAILDNKTKYYFKRDDFKYWMQNSVSGVTSGLVTMFKGGSIGNFNLIEISNKK